MAMVRSIMLNSGYKMPMLGFGTWQSDRDKLTNALQDALYVGYRHIDTAYLYKNEDIIGNVVQRAITQGKIKREELFITTKLPGNGHHPDLVKHFLEQSLEKLGLKYIDLYLIHYPMGLKYAGDENVFSLDSSGRIILDSRINLTQTWRSMENCVKLGLTKSIGLSNFNSKQVTRICNLARIRPANLQVECNAYFNQKKLRHLCQHFDIVMTAYSPLGLNSLQEFNYPGSIFKPTKHRNLLEDSLVRKIAKNYNKTPAQVALRYLVQSNICVIPKSVTPERIVENFQIFDFMLTDEEMLEMNNLAQNSRTYKHDFFKGMTEHPEYPFNEE